MSSIFGGVYLWALGLVSFAVSSRRAYFLESYHSGGFLLWALSCGFFAGRGSSLAGRCFDDSSLVGSLL